MVALVLFWFSCFYIINPISGIVELPVVPQSTCVERCGGGVDVEFDCVAVSGGITVSQQWNITNSSSNLLLHLDSSNPMGFPNGYELYPSFSGPEGLRVLNVSAEMNGYSFTCIGFDVDSNASNVSPSAILEVSGLPSLSCSNNGCGTKNCEFICRALTASCSPIIEVKLETDYDGVYFQITDTTYTETHAYYENPIIDLGIPHTLNKPVVVVVSNTCGTIRELFNVDSASGLSVTKYLGLFLVVVSLTLQL